MAKIFNMDDFGVVVYSDEGKLIYECLGEYLDIDDESIDEVFDMYETINSYDESPKLAQDTMCDDNELGEAYEYGRNVLKLDMTKMENLYIADKKFYGLQQEREIKYYSISEIKEYLNQDIDEIPMNKLDIILAMVKL